MTNHFHVVREDAPRALCQLGTCRSSDGNHSRRTNHRHREEQVTWWRTASSASSVDSDAYAVSSNVYVVSEPREGGASA